MSNKRMKALRRAHAPKTEDYCCKSIYDSKLKIAYFCKNKVVYSICLEGSGNFLLSCVKHKDEIVADNLYFRPNLKSIIELFDKRLEVIK